MLKILSPDKALEFCNLWPYRRRHESRYSDFLLIQVKRKTARDCLGRKHIMLADTSCAPAVACRLFG